MLGMMKMNGKHELGLIGLQVTHLHLLVPSPTEPSQEANSLLSTLKPFFGVSSSYHSLLKECIVGREDGRETKANVVGGGYEMLGPMVDTSIHRLHRVARGHTAFPELLTSATFPLAVKLL